MTDFKGHFRPLKCHPTETVPSRGGGGYSIQGILPEAFPYHHPITGTDSMALR